MSVVLTTGMDESRRRFLARSASVCGLAGVTAGLAGCTGSDTATRGGTPAGGSREATQTPTDRLRLEALDVGGSPGGRVVVEPPGEVALLDFFATWCAPCKPQMGELRAVRESVADLHMLSVTREAETEAVASFWREFDGTWPVAQDPELAAFRTYGVSRIPTLVVVDPSGTEVWRHSGLAATADVVENVEAARR